MLKRMATLKFKMFDILNQSRNTYRTTADNYIEDITNNTLQQYFMVSFTIRFGSFGGSTRDGMRRGGFGGRGRGSFGGFSGNPMISM